MKAGNRKSLTATVVLTVVCLVAWGVPVQADDAVPFVNNNSCKKCHIQQFKSWEKTPMGTALNILKPNERSDKKIQAGLDPAKDYTTDATCLRCHTVGLGLPGGYEVPDPADPKAVRKANALAHVGCESCHGPGGSYSDFHKEIMTASKNYTHEDMYAAGMAKITAETCTKCHNDESPTHKFSEPFDYEKMKGVGLHEHFELKLLKE